jgi:hypothetical protein
MIIAVICVVLDTLIAGVYTGIPNTFLGGIGVLIAAFVMLSVVFRN